MWECCLPRRCIWKKFAESDRGCFKMSATPVAFVCLCPIFEYVIIDFSSRYMELCALQIKVPGMRI